MNIYPPMDIRFPPKNEAALVQGMMKRAKSPWTWQDHDPFGRLPKEGRFYFHRASIETDPPCTLCIHRETPGHLVVHAITPDANSENDLAVDRFVAILVEFDAQIAAPAADEVHGITQVGMSTIRMEDHYSPEAIRLLENFCSASNKADRGTHFDDQEKWMRFLIYIFRNNEVVHCDKFGACLMAKRWWPAEGVSDLVHQYDFAMRLLRQAAKTM